MILAAFIDAYCNNINVPENWEEILQEWAWLMKDQDGQRMFGLADKIVRWKCHVDFVEYATLLLERRYDEEVAERLNQEYPGDYRSSEQIALTRSLVGTRKYELSIMEDEYARLMNTGKGEKATEADFEKNIQHLSKFQGYRLDKQVITVAEYGSIYTNFITEIKNRE